MHPTFLGDPPYLEGLEPSHAETHIPVTQPEPMHGPDNIQLFQSMPDPPRQSDEQGIGRSPGQRWPHMPHVIQHNYEALSNMGWQVDGTVTVERQGWSAPVFYEMAAGQHYTMVPPIIIADPPTTPYSGLNEVGP